MKVWLYTQLAKLFNRLNSVSLYGWALRKRYEARTGKLWGEGLDDDTTGSH